LLVLPVTTVIVVSAELEEVEEAGACNCFFALCLFLLVVVDDDAVVVVTVMVDVAEDCVDVVVVVVFIAFGVAWRGDGCEAITIGSSRCSPGDRGNATTCGAR
jgi:hypothetical protein